MSHPNKLPPDTATRIIVGFLFIFLVIGSAFLARWMLGLGASG